MIRLGSVNLISKDIRALERFYVEILGLAVDEERSNRPSFLLLRAENCMIILQEGSADGNASGAELGFEVPDVNAMKERLGDRGSAQEMGWGDAIETADPDGTRLNLYRLKS